MGNRSKSAFSELIDSIKYYFESKSGKYSLDTYLDIIGEYADRHILDKRGQGFDYLGGECSICKSVRGKALLVFRIELFFKNPAGNTVKEDATRELPMEKFVAETVQQIGQGTLKFHIQAPSDK